MRNLTAIAILPAAALTLAACGSSERTVTDVGPAATLATTETTSPQASDAATDAATGTRTQGPADGAGGFERALFGTPADVGGPYGALRDGIWAVGPAGEVEFRVTGPDTVELVDVRANDGWEVTEQESDSDSLDVDFRQGQVVFELQVEIDGGVLEIEIDQDIDPAEGGSFALGEAGTAQVTVADGRVVLGEVTLSDGWTEIKREAGDDDAELDLRREGDGFFELWELQADLDDGRLDIEVDYEIEGRFGG